MQPLQGRSPLINIIFNTCTLAARYILKDFRELENLQNSKRDKSDFLNKTLINLKKNFEYELSKARPEWPILDNNFKIKNYLKKGFKDNFWVISSLDGKENFVNGVPHFSISIAVINDCKISVAGIFDPIRREFFYAENGKGAYMNNSRIRVSAKDKFESSLIATEKKYIDEDDLKYNLEDINEFINLGANIRVSGCNSIDISWVACGRYDAFLTHNLNLQDTISGILLVGESGGLISNLKLQEDYIKFENICLGNPSIYSKLISIINSKKALSHS